MTESPEAARAMAWPMVLQAIWGDRQLLLSLPLNPLTYHVVLANKDGDTAMSSAKPSVLLFVSIRSWFSSRWRAAMLASLAVLLEN